MFHRYISTFKEEYSVLYKSIFTKGSFAQNFAFNFSGKAIGILAQVAFAPLLARIYGPEAYGVFAVFNATAANLALVSTLRLEGALILPKDDDEFNPLVKSVFIISFFSSLLITAITIVSKDSIETLFDGKKVGNLFYALGPFIFLVCTFQITNNWVIRKKAFKDAFHYGIPISIGSKVFNLLYGLLSKGAAYGLILSDAVMRIVTIGIRFKYIIKDRSFTATPLSWAAFKATLKKYKQFPLFDMPGNWINALSSQLPIYLLTIGFGANPVGQFGFAASLLDIPMSMLGNAISPVFLQKAQETYLSKPEKIPELTVQLYQKLLLVGLLPFSFITVFGDKVFQWVFGEKWYLAGVFAGYLGFYYLFRLISSPMTSIFVILNKQNKFIYFHLFLFAGRAASLSIGLFLLKSVTWAVLLFSAFNSVAYLLLSIWILHLVQAPIVKPLAKSISLILVSFTALYGLKMLLF